MKQRNEKAKGDLSVPSKRDKLILIVDDEEAIVDSLSTFLSQAGYSVTGMTNSEEALESVNRETYDIVLTDLVMPEVTGIDIVKAVKESGHDTQVIIFTGYASTGSAIEAIKLGVYDYIRKPFELKEIEVAVGRALEKQQLKRENIALSERIERMLSQVTMLYDISTILYQVSEFEPALDMILDTLCEGMAIEKAGILLESGSTGFFEPVRWRGLNPDFVRNFNLTLSEKINGIPISSSAITEIPNCRSGLVLRGKRLRGSRSINRCILIPVQFLDRLMGFLGIFQMGEGIFSYQEEMKLLKIFATQIAPVVYSFRPGDNASFFGPRHDEEQMYGLIDGALATARSLGSSISFVLIRLSILKTPDGATFLKDLQSACGRAVQKVVDPTGDWSWLTYDTALLLLPASNPVAAEFTCVNVKQLIEELELPRYGKTDLLVKYAHVCFPQEGTTAQEIVRVLWHRLFSELQPPFNYSGNR